MNLRKTNYCGGEKRKKEEKRLIGKKGGQADESFTNRAPVPTKTQGKEGGERCYEITTLKKKKERGEARFEARPLSHYEYLYQTERKKEGEGGGEADE